MRASLMRSFLAQQSDLLAELVGIGCEAKSLVGAVGRPTARVGKRILSERDHLDHRGLDGPGPVSGNVQTRLRGTGWRVGHGCSGQKAANRANLGYGIWIE